MDDLIKTMFLHFGDIDMLENFVCFIKILDGIISSQKVIIHH